MLILICPQCGGRNTISHKECSYGFARTVYTCNDCNWTNRYNQISNVTTTNNTFINGTYIYKNSIGGMKNAR